MALAVLIDRITHAMENGEYVLVVFLDFGKAFHTVDHNILMQKNEFFWHSMNCTGLDEKLFTR